MKKFKKILSMGLMSALCISLVSCSSSDSSSSSSGNSGSSSSSQDGVIQLEFWYAYTDKIQENNIALTEEFNQTVGAELGIEVTPVYQGDYIETHQKLQAAYVAGQAPAISVMEIASTRLYAENGVILNLDEYIATDSVDVDDFYSGLTENCIVDGSYYGLPYLRSTPVFYMNTTLLEEAGLDTKGPETWDEFADYCKTVKEELGIYGFAMFSYDWILESFFFQYGSSVLSADETSTNINSDTAKEIISFFKELEEQDLIVIYANADSAQLSTEIMNQTSAMWVQSTGNLTNYMNIGSENGFEVGTAYIPKEVTHGVPTGGCNLVITSKLTDAETEAAWEFVQWMTSTENTVKASTNTGYVVTRLSATETPEIQDLFASTPQAKVALDQLEEYGNGRPMHPSYAEVSKELHNTMDAIWVSGMDMDTTLAEAETRINSILAG